MRLIKSFCRDEQGAAAIEYGMITALIAVVIVAVLQTIGTELNSKFETISNALDGNQDVPVAIIRPRPIMIRMDPIILQAESVSMDY